MSAIGVDSLDHSIQETNLWLKAVMRHLETVDRHLAYAVLRATLHALRDRIGPENAVHLGAQLPMLIRGLYYEGWHMAGTPTKERHKEAFLDHLRRTFGPRSEVDRERAARAVFDVMWEKIDPGKVAKVVKLLPEELRALFPCLARGE
ncbi:MAG: DUF2267 domain-containing protein [Rhodospirillales bacterium]|nr:DUF2267 domain-containing protein [Rhodospirillales bacterium]